MEELSSKYSPREVERKWYQWWMEQGLFSSRPDGREPYTVVIPPPNVTGVLHMGHMLNETIQDILVRRKRQEGRNVCWVPGTDHASIATEAKVVSRLRERGIEKRDLTREAFLEHAWEWTREKGGIILEQLKEVGASCDWQRTAFTLDEERSRSVIKVFVDLYRKGLIYRGVRMVNWDPKARTALSDEEVVYKEEHGKLYYLRYYLAGEESTISEAAGEESAVSSAAGDGNVIHTDALGRRYAVVATTRPETIMGDTAMCINPHDAKNRWLSGCKVTVPLVGRVIPVIEDDYVDVDFGTGCLKVTPAHDINDYRLGQTHNLPSINIFEDDGTIAPAAGLYVGMDRFEVRERIARDLEAAGLMEKVEDYTNNVGFSERTDVPIEPRLSTQWFLSMRHFADMALPPVMDDTIRFHPAKYKNTYRHWLENIKDWCISRQLWWGHRIPAWYLPDGTFVVAGTEDEALALARAKQPELSKEDLRQDEDALDTWFSSWLWPMSLFSGVTRPGNEEMRYYYPTSDLVTGPDIIFFWVARMIMAGYEYTGQPPFRNVYFTGIVRDKLGRKMSKSLGNSPDPLALIEEYGADGVRMGLMLAAPAGNDLLYDDALSAQGRNFCNKLWNCRRLLASWPVDGSLEQREESRVAARWMEARLRQTAREVEDLMGKYRLSEALAEIYRTVEDDFSSWYLEAVKPPYRQPCDALTLGQARTFFRRLCQLLHPFMPFITEELWHTLAAPGEEAGSVMTAPLFPSKEEDGDASVLSGMARVQDIVRQLRAIRAKHNLAKHDALTLLRLKGEEGPATHCDGHARVSLQAGDLKFGNQDKRVESAAGPDGCGEEQNTAGPGALLLKMGCLAAVEHGRKGPGMALFMVGTEEYGVPLTGLVDEDAEREKALKELAHLEGFLRGVEKKLQNERFLASAPPQVVETERKKQADATKKIQALKQRLG